MSWALLGVDLLESPLPTAREAIKAIPKVMPAKRDGHSDLIYGPPWYVRHPVTPLRRVLPVPHPASYPPLRHLLGSLSASSGRSGYPSELVAVNKSATLPSSPPVAPTSAHSPRSTHSTSATPGVAPKSSSSATSPPLPLASATVKEHGSRFHTVAKGFVRMGWESPLTLWGSILGTEIKSYIFPTENVNAYSTLRERWHLAFCKPSNMLQWLLHMEEHSFDLFLVKSVVTLCIRSRSSLSVQNREKTLAMASVCTNDMREHYKTLRHDDSQLPYVTSVLEHVKAIISLQIPLDKDFTFPLAPTWISPPSDNK